MSPIHAPNGAIENKNMDQRSELRTSSCEPKMPPFICLIGCTKPCNSRVQIIAQPPSPVGACSWVFSDGTFWTVIASRSCTTSIETRSPDETSPAIILFASFVSTSRCIALFSGRAPYEGSYLWRNSRGGEMGVIGKRKILSCLHGHSTDAVTTV